MTSRVEAVASAIAAAQGWDYDKCNGIRRDAFRVQAQAAIEASEAWKMHRIICPNCRIGQDQDATECWLCDAPLIVVDEQQ